MSIAIRAISAPEISDLMPTMVKECGNIIEIKYYDRINDETFIQKLDKDTYIRLRDAVDYSTGELIVHEFEHTENRAQSYKELLNSFAKLRDIINANVSDVSTVHWCTLTYAENMTDQYRVSSDFKDFWDRLKVYCRTSRLPTPKYIYAKEPQERGAWHIHLLILWPCLAPFIPHEEFWKMWSPIGYKNNRDFVCIKSLTKDGKAIDNLGAYLCSYLTDTYSESEKAAKKFQRLHLYPTGMRIFATSQGIKRPTKTKCYAMDAKGKVAGLTATFRNATEISDIEKDFRRLIVREYYNKLRPENQE